MKCECGFEFSKAGEFRNCNCYMNDKREWIYVCPKCGKEYKNES